MYFFFTPHPVQHPDDETGNEVLVPLRDHEHNTNEGSEFLDDAIRIHDQPFMDIVDQVSAGSPES